MILGSLDHGYHEESIENQSQLSTPFARPSLTSSIVRSTIEKEMKLQTIAIVMLFLSLAGCYRGSVEWQAELHDQDGKMALTFRLWGREEEKERTIVFEDVDAGVTKPRFYTLPKEADEIPDTEFTFQDTTLLPGRITLRVNDHEVDEIRKHFFTKTQT